MKVMNQGVGEEGKLVVHGNVINVKERTSYGVTIYKGCCKHQSCLQWQSSSQLKFLSKNVKLLIEKKTKKSFRLRWLKKILRGWLGVFYPWGKNLKQVGN